MKNKRKVLVVVLSSVAVLTQLLTLATYADLPFRGNAEYLHDKEEPIALCIAEDNTDSASVKSVAESSSLKKRLIHHREILKKLVETGRQGTKGRLVFDNVDFSVALYESDQHAGPDAQMLVDAEDSAAWYMWFENQSPIIADHCNQGFDIIKECSIGDFCYIVNGKKYQKYVCVAIDSDAVNERDNMYLSSGYNFSRKNEPGYLYMYTCNQEGDSYHITVVTWTPLEDVE